MGILNGDVCSVPYNIQQYLERHCGANRLRQLGKMLSVHSVYRKVDFAVKNYLYIITIKIILMICSILAVLCITCNYILTD